MKYRSEIRKVLIRMNARPIAGFHVLLRGYDGGGATPLCYERYECCYVRFCRLFRLEMKSFVVTI